MGTVKFMPFHLEGQDNPYDEFNDREADCWEWWNNGWKSAKEHSNSENKLTPLQHLLKFMDEDKSGVLHSYDRQLITDEIKRLMPVEKQQILDAYNQDLYGGLEGHTKYEDGEDYYNQTYKS